MMRRSKQLMALEKKVVSARSEALLPEIASVLQNRQIENTWQASAAGIYRNWLAHICAQKETALVSERLKEIASLQPVS